ncbi:hypothetical protein CDL12_00536 [Handroanthus impetiginosus]|uniref:Uncharacterized protein n=1 Tax=Handroanthus impetiginosus TaxID=429701 RepID=A0A2G9IAC3_9LAMI|nr:hypothetical protein CDL12_00536 [Handroanthus impetiginosus]
MNISDVNMRSNNQSPMSRSTEEKGGIRDDSDFSRIEELIKGNTFSREEINHFLEILNSRVDNELEKPIPSNNAGDDTQPVSRPHEFRRMPSEEKQQDTDRAIIGAFGEKSEVPVGVSASPIDIARAYMAGRTSEGGHDIHSLKSKGERAELSNEFARKPFLPSPSPKPSICWPGAIVHDHHGYTTPQSQRGRHRLHDFPGTPYSRTILSKSTTKLQADSGYASTLTPFQQSQTSTYGQVKSRGDTIDVYGSVGPIRRIRNKFASEVRPRGSMFLSSPKETPSKRETPKVLGGFLPRGEKKFEPGETNGASKYWSGDNVLGSSDGGISNHNISSSQAVRKILEHLDRTKPTPKEKEAELKLVTAWRRSSPEPTDNIRDEKISSLPVGELASHKNTDIAGTKLAEEFNKSSSTSKFLVNFHDKGVDEAKDADNGNIRASSAVFTVSSIIPGSSALLHFGLKGTSNPVVKNSNENAFATTSRGQTGSSLQFPPPHPSNGRVEKTVAGPIGFEFSKIHGTKPSLPSISINKPEFRSVSSDNGPGFTFPVSASSGVLSEPPTPSIAPSSSSTILPQPIGMSSIPSYTFGTNKSTPRLVFSFPSSSNASTHDDSDLKFSFGSDKKTRLSFSSIGKDTICY